MDMGDERCSEPRLVHFKCRHDPGWDYKSIANTLFVPHKKILVVGEKWFSNPHVHMQGYTYDAPRTFADKISALAKTHCTRDPNHISYVGPKARPMSQGSGNVNLTGFQYMTKEPFSAHNPIFQNGFTQEELEALHAASDAHVEKIKFKVRDYLNEVLTQADFDKAKASERPSRMMYALAVKYVVRAMRKEGKNMTMHTKRDIINALIHHPMCSEELACGIFDQC